MKHPLKLIIHVPLREKRDFRQTLVGLKNALCITFDGLIATYDLLPLLKPRKGQEYRVVEQIAQQLSQGGTILLWDVDRFLREVEQIVNDVRVAHPKLAAATEAAWAVISAADEEQIVDLRSFRKLPNGHYVTIVAERQEIDLDDYSPRRRRRLMACIPKSRPVSEDFWGVLHRVIMTKSEAELVWSAYQRWVRNGRPRPPRPDLNRASSQLTATPNGWSSKQ